MRLAGWGVALAILFGTVPAAGDSRLTNISTRGMVGTGDGVMIGGIIIEGDSAATVLIRGRGPSLADAGVQGTLANPLLQLFDQSTGALILTNDDWASDPRASWIPAALAPTNAAEAALLTTLDPGAYTAILSGADAGTGVGIVEAFELDVPALDHDGDGIADVDDTDVDGDGVPNAIDEFDFDGARAGDFDGDGIDNLLDSDDDNDGTGDASDPFPLDPLETADSDGNGLGDNAQASMAAGVNPYSSYTLERADVREATGNNRFWVSDDGQRAFGLSFRGVETILTVYGRDAGGLLHDPLGHTVIETRVDNADSRATFNVQADGARAYVHVRQASTTEEISIYNRSFPVGISSNLHVVEVAANGTPAVTQSVGLDPGLAPDYLFVSPWNCGGCARIYVGGETVLNPDTFEDEPISPPATVEVDADGVATLLPGTPALPSRAFFYANEAWSADGGLLFNANDRSVTVHQAEASGGLAELYSFDLTALDSQVRGASGVALGGDGTTLYTAYKTANAGNPQFVARLRWDGAQIAEEQTLLVATESNFSSYGGYMLLSDDESALYVIARHRETDAEGVARYRAVTHQITTLAATMQLVAQTETMTFPGNSVYTAEHAGDSLVISSSSNVPVQIALDSDGGFGAETMLELAEDQMPGTDPHTYTLFDPAGRNVYLGSAGVFVNAASVGDETVSWRQQIFDVDTFTRRGSRGAALTHAGDWLILTGASFSGDVIGRFEIDTDGHMTQRNTLPVSDADLDGRPVFSADDRTLYATAYFDSNEDDDGDGTTDAAVTLVAFDFDRESGDVSIRGSFDTGSRRNNYSPELLETGTVALTLSPAGDVLYMLDTYRGSLSAYDIATDGTVASHLSSAAVLSGPEGDIQLAPNGDIVVATAPESGPPTVSAFVWNEGSLVAHHSLSTNLTSSLGAFAGGTDLLIMPDGREILMAALFRDDNGKEHSSLMRIARDGNGLIWPMVAFADEALDRPIQTLAISPDGSRIIATDFGSTLLLKRLIR